MKKQSKPITFKVKTSFGFEFTCTVFSNRKLMQVYATKNGFPQTEDTEAFCHVHEVSNLRKGKWSKFQEKGYVCFHAKKFGGGMVAHEMTHAALFAIGMRKKIRSIPTLGMRGLADDRNEMLAYEIGALCSQFWNKWYKKDKKK